MNLATYLEKILQQQPINYDEFKKKLSADEQRDHHHIFKPIMLAPKTYQVEILDRERFHQMIKQACAKPTTRIEAAQSGDSHKVATSFSHLLVFHQASNPHQPDVVVIHNDQIMQSFESKRQLLIIENEENFFRFAEILPLLSTFTGQPLGLDHCDIAYGAGNQINKALNLSWFEQYDTVFCAFDWDFGGLQMFKTLSERVQASVQLVMPDDLAPWQKYFKKPPKSNQQWLGALDLAQTLGFTGLSDAFKSNLCFMEQEVWLAE